MQFSIFPWLHEAFDPFPSAWGKAGMGGGGTPTGEDAENCMALVVVRDACPVCGANRYKKRGEREPVIPAP